MVAPFTARAAARRLRLLNALVVSLPTLANCQGIGGGDGGGYGGGGGGFGGGGANDNSDDSGNDESRRQCFVSHCHSCQFFSETCCSTCDTGYARVGCECAPCSANCYSCDREGPGKCDACHSGFYMFRADADADAAEADIWQRARPRVFEGCRACSENCKRCHGDKPADCEACLFFYFMRHPGAGCFLNYGAVYAVLVAILCVAITWWCWHSRTGPRHTRRHSREGAAAAAAGAAGARRRGSPPPSISAHLGEEESDEAASAAAGTRLVSAPYLFPSGAWRGYYRTDAREHGVVEFELRFSPEGSVSGSGRDDVGEYTIDGRHRRGRIAFRKQYAAGSRTAGGQLSKENAGHAVEYRGSAARTRPDGTPSLSGGVRGSWAIRHRLGDSDGTWHLWPVVLARREEEDDERDETTPARSGVGGDGAGGAAAAEEEETEVECVVCYDRAIDTCLKPCNHAALCHFCAVRLPNRRCPLCRAPIREMRPAQAWQPQRGGESRR